MRFYSHFCSFVVLQASRGRLTGLRRRSIVAVVLSAGGMAWAQQGIDGPFQHQLLASASAATATVKGGMDQPHSFLDLDLQDLVSYRITTMARKEQTVREAASAAYVITSEEILRSGASSIPQALRMVPGLNVAQLSSDRWAVSSRGFNELFSAKLLVLMDGVSIYSPTFSGVIWAGEAIPMADIDRIEVIRGPGAALWGVNAMNGVINIVTKSAQSSARGGDANLLQLDVGTGQQQSLALRRASELADGSALSLTAQGTRAGASSLYRVPGQQVAAPGISSGDGQDHFRQWHAGLKFDKSLNGLRTSTKLLVNEHRSSSIWVIPTVSAYENTADRNIYLSTLDGLTRTARIQTRLQWGEANEDNTLQMFLDSSQAIHLGMWGSGTRLGGAGVAEVPRPMRVGGRKTDADIDFQQRRRLANHDLVWGVAARWTTDTLLLPAGPYSVDQVRDTRWNLSAFVNDELSLDPDWKVVIGAKVERDGITGFNLQPNVRSIYKLSPQHVLWGALSDSRRSPRRTETQATLDVNAVDAAPVLAMMGVTVPSGAITQFHQVRTSGQKPVAEKALSLESGWRGELGADLSMDLAGFITRYNHLRGGRVDGSATPDIGAALACANAGMHPGQCYYTIAAATTSLDKATSWGFEGSLVWRVNPRWRMQAAYSYLRVNGDEVDDLLARYQTTIWENSAPRHSYFLRSHHSFDGGQSLDLALQHTSSTAHFVVRNDRPHSLGARKALDIRYGWRWMDAQWALSLKNIGVQKKAEFINALPYMQGLSVQPSAHLSVLWKF
jgi:iron complex outermembrane receptor protein